MILKDKNIKASNGVKTVLVHDYLTQPGGAERVLLSLARIFPDAPIYTLLYDAEKMSGYMADRDVRPSFLNKLPKFLRSNKRLLLPLLPKAAESFDLSGYDLVISSSSAFAKGIIKDPKAIHICYCHAPARFLWDYKDRYQKDNRFSLPARIFINLTIARLRRWDKASSRRVDFWIANSETTKERIKKYYNKDSVVIYPPLIDLCFRAAELPIEKDYFLIVARLTAYKKIDIIIGAFNDLGWSLIIVGDGQERKRLERISGKNIKFAGFISDEELAGYYARSRAFILANEEDFGLAALEAASFGKPVLAYRQGGATGWLEEGKTGEFFERQTKESAIEALRKMEAYGFAYDPEYIKKSTERFSKEAFQKNILNFVDGLV